MVAERTFFTGIKFDLVSKVKMETSINDKTERKNHPG
jgi:hypothetical protein